MASTSIPGPDEALAGMAKTGAPRKPMGKDALKFTNVSGANSDSTTLVPKKNLQAGDPTGMGTKVNRENVQQTPAMERMGASYTVKGIIHKPTDPAAGMTQANGRIFASATNRDRGNFDSGAGSSY
jgi:hypothetical protein